MCTSHKSSGGCRDTLRDSARRHRRRGMSMMLVMVAVSSSVVITYAVIQTQAVNVQVAQNVLRRDLALQAAHTGAAIALDAMQSPEWGGVTTRLQRTLFTDAAGASSYEVTFEPCEGTQSGAKALDAALQVRVRAVGRWQEAASGKAGSVTPRAVERVVEVLVRLEPRMPGRSLEAGEPASVVDLAPNPDGFDTVQQYAIFARANNDSLTLQPCSRVEGSIFLRHRIALFNDVSYSSSQRNTVLSELKTRFVSGSGSARAVQMPHPISGTITFNRSPQSSNVTDLTRLGVPYAIDSSLPNLSSVNGAEWLTYQLYEGGHTYSAEVLPSSLNRVTLQPGPTNPLGIFYRSSSLTLGDDVSIQGTLVCQGTLYLNGRNIHLQSLNWRGPGGTLLAPQADQWPRLPAVMATSVSATRGCAVRIEGAVVARNALSGGGGQFELKQPQAPVLSATVTASPGEQPWSSVQVQTTTVDLRQIEPRGFYEIWLPRDVGGNWYPIETADPQTRQLTIRGDVSRATPVAAIIRSAREQYLDIHGPVCGEYQNIDAPTAWSGVSSIVWSLWNFAWQSEVSATPKSQTPPLFTEWLENRYNLLGWGYPHSTYGLTLEPTFHVRHVPEPGGALPRYRWSPPLFRAYTTTSNADRKYAGYRWTVVSWRELQ